MLEVDALTVRFGGVTALEDVALEAGAGAVLGLAGPNGSGKTTLLNAVCGLVPAAGRVRVGGRALRLGRPVAAARAGVARVFQAPQTFEELSVLENVLLGSADRRARGATAAWFRRRALLRHERARGARARRALADVGLAGDPHRPAAGLAYGQRRLLDLARALVSDPRVLLLDEPSAGLNGGETAALAGLLAGLRRDQGAERRTVVVVDHKIDFLDAVCDRLVVLDAGRVIAAGEPTAVWADRHVRRAYLGGAAGARG